MKYQPAQDLKEFIDAYWIVKNAQTFFEDQGQLVAYPGITPEMLIVLEGSFGFQYEGKYTYSSNSTVFSFIKEKLVFDHSQLQAFIIVQFKPLGLFSLRQFVPLSSKKILEQPICNAETLFTTKITKLTSLLKQIPDLSALKALDRFFRECLYQPSTGFVEQIAKSLKNGLRLKDIEGASYATIERHFKAETGVNPKQFQSLQRYKLAVQEIYETKNKDWIHYVEKYNYYDQSHFIKEIKRYTSFTPAQLCDTPALLNYRNISS